jgi:hypothetical protein
MRTSLKTMLKILAASALVVVFARLSLSQTQRKPSTAAPVAAADKPDSFKPDSGKLAVVSSSPLPSGRYQIVFGPHARADTFLLDTQTGKVWVRTAFTFLQGEPDAWVPLPHFENEKEQETWVDLHQRKASALPPTKTTPDGRPKMPDLNTFPGSLAEYNAAVAKYEADFEKWALEKARAK